MLALILTNVHTVARHSGLGYLFDLISSAYMDPLQQHLQQNLVTMGVISVGSSLPPYINCIVIIGVIQVRGHMNVLVVGNAFHRLETSTFIGRDTKKTMLPQDVSPLRKVLTVLL
jgi:hypothetical protein